MQATLLLAPLFILLKGMNKKSQLWIVIVAALLSLLPLLSNNPALANTEIIEPDSGISKINGNFVVDLGPYGTNGVAHPGDKKVGVADTWHWNLYRNVVNGFCVGGLCFHDISWKWNDGCAGTDCGEHAEDAINHIPEGLLERTWKGHHTHCGNSDTHAMAVADSYHPGTPNHDGYCAHTHPEPEDEPVCAPDQRILIDIHKGGSLSTPAARDAHIGNHLYSNPDCPTHTHCINEPAHNAVEQKSQPSFLHKCAGHGSRLIVILLPYSES